MNNPYIGIVNQRIALALHQLRLTVDETSSAEKMRNQSCTYAGLWHLSNAYKAYVLEVGASYKVEQPEKAYDAAKLSEILESMNKAPAEARELVDLEKNGFIGQLQKALSTVEAVESGLMLPAPDKLKTKVNLAEYDPLSLKNITSVEDKLEINAERLSDWINEFKALISRHRELMIEY